MKLIKNYAFIVFMLVFAISAHWGATTIANSVLIKHYVGGIGAGLLFLGVLYQKRHSFKITIAINYLNLSLLMFFVLGFVSLLWSVDIESSINKILIYLAVLFAFLYSYNLKQTDDNLFIFAQGVSLAGLVIAIVGISQYWFNTPFLMQSAYPGSTFGNKNMAAQSLVLIFPLVLFWFSSGRVGRLNQYARALALSLIMTFIFYTSTRAAWLSITIEILLIVGFLWTKRHNIKDYVTWSSDKTNALVVSVILTLILLNFNADGFTPFWETLFNNLDKTMNNIENKSYSRYQIYAMAIEMIKDNPWFGSGLGSFMHNSATAGYSTFSIASIQRVHNDILEIGVDFGFVGLALFTILLGSILYGLRQVVKKSASNQVWFYYLLFASLSGSFVNMQFSFPYQMAFPTILFGFFMGFLVQKLSHLKLNFYSLTLQLKPLHKTIFNTIWVVVFAIMLSIYLSWIGVYNQLDKINQSANFSNIESIDSLITNQEMLGVLGSLGGAYFYEKRWTQAEDILRFFLKKWPNHNIALYQLSHTLYQQKKYTKALLIAKQGKKMAGYGEYRSHITELQIYLAMNDKTNFRKYFLEFWQQGHDNLKWDKNNYTFLHYFAQMDKNLYPYIKLISNQRIKQ